MRGMMLAVGLLTSGCSAIVGPDGARLGGPADGGSGPDGDSPPDAGPLAEDGRMPSADGARPDGATGCPEPGRVERVSCGTLCGTAERVCSADGSWQQGPCEDEGECVAGERVEVSCGAARREEVMCRDDCRIPEPDCSTDVLLLIDVTGSFAETIDRNADAFIEELVGPLLETGETRVGIAYFADYPLSPYGARDDVPFAGHVPPTADLDLLREGLQTLPALDGGDLPESAIEGLWVLAGGEPDGASQRFDCPEGRGRGGCWREDVQRAVLVVTDVAQHHMPSPALEGMPVSPYDDRVGAPSWTEVRDRLTAQSTALFAIVRRRDADPALDGYRQFAGLARALEQRVGDSIVGYRVESAEVDLGPPLARMRALLADYHGL